MTVSAKEVILADGTVAQGVVIVGTDGVPFDNLTDYDINVVSKNAGGSPLVIQYFTGGLSGTLVKTQTLTYDVDGDPQTVVWS